MPTPRTFALLIAGSAMLFTPAAFADAPKTQDVTIEIDFEASPEATYENIRQQAWQVCKPDLGSTYASARNRVRRACQKQVVADVIKQLTKSDQILVAANAASETP